MLAAPYGASRAVIRVDELMPLGGAARLMCCCSSGPLTLGGRCLRPSYWRTAIREGPIRPRTTSSSEIRR
jgi:hypothetical protein